MKNRRNPLQVGLKLNILDRCLVLVVSLLILVVLIVFHTYTHNAKESQQDLIRMVMEKMSINQKTQFERYIDDKIQILEALVTYPEVYRMQDEEQKEFLGQKAKAMGFQHFFVVNADGIGYYIDEGIHRNQSKEPFFYSIMQNEVFVTEPFKMNTSTTIMTACVSIYDGQGEKVGVLCGAINLDNIQLLIQNNEMILNGDCFVLDRSGNFITPQKKLDTPAILSIYNTADSELSLIKSSFRDQKDLEGTIRMHGVEYQAYLTYLQDYNWVIVQCVPVSEITQRFENMTYLQMMLVVLASALIFCIIRIVYCWKKSDKKIYTDSLTKGNNRAACLSLLDSLEKKRNWDIAIIYMDLNRFKYVNDTFGHDKGDELIRIFARTLQKVFGEIGFAGRMGGDEFIAILREFSDAEILKLCQRVEEILAEESKGIEFSYTMSSSYGIAIRKKGQSQSLQEILQKADEKMYEYKIAHKQCES